MKITSIRLKNINSFKGEHFIDFQKDIPSKIFAITGVTGSGKSTLLDVITLALYHQIPRIGDISKSKIEKTKVVCTRNIFEESISEVEYIVQNQKYRSKWSISYNRNKNLNNPEMELVHVESGEILATRTDVSAKNTEIIRLNFDQFVKSILLAQGEFARLLKANATERGKLLEKITGQDIYRQLSIFSYKREKDEKSKLGQIEQKIRQLNLFSDEKIEELQQEINKLKEQENELIAKYDVFQGLLNIKNQIQQQENKLLQEYKNFQIVQQKQQDFVVKTKRVILADAIKVERERYRQLQERIKEEQGLQEQVEASQKEQNTFSNLIENIEKNKKSAIQERDKLQQHQQKYEPIFQKVRELDIEINQDKAQYQQKKVEIDDEQNQFNGFEKQFDEDKKKLVLQEKGLVDLEQKLFKSNVLEHVSKDIPQLTSLENDIKNQFTHLRQKIQHIVKSHKIQFPTFSNIQELDSFVQTELIKLKENPFQQADSQFIENVDEVISEYENSQNTIKHIFSKNSEKYQNAGVEIVKIEKEIIVIDNLILQLATQLQGIQQKLEQNQKEFQAIQVQKNQLENEARYEQARQELSEGENCPLCGSEHHPYVLHYEGKLNEIVRQFDEFQKNQTLFQKEILQVSNQISTKNAEKKSLLNEIEKQQKQKEEAFNEFQNIVNQDITISDIGQKSTFWNAKIQSIGEEILKLKNKKSEHQKFLLFQQNQDIFSDLNQLIQQILEKERQFNDLFSVYQHLLVNEKTVEKLVKLSDAYQKDKTQKQELERDCSVLSERCKNKKEQYEDKVNALFAKNEQLKLLENAIVFKQQERNTLLRKENPDEAEKRLRTKLQDEENKIQDCDNSLDTTRAILKEKALQLGELEKKKAFTVEKNEKDKLELNNLVQKFGITYLQLYEYNFSDEEIESVKKQEKEIQEQLVKIQQIIDTLKQDISSFQQKDNIDLSIEFVQKTFDEVKKELNKNKENRVKVEYLVEQDVQNRSKNSQFVQEKEIQEKEYNRWKSLYDVIGSEKGDNFSKYAQDLTFLHLIQLANQRLSKLDARYKLKKYDDREEVWVIDSYQADAERSIATLSGGETFLVSLAMALGLSDMASRNVKIESLFIDEGFGTLDEETLDSALSTLENLQVQSNRTIAIISHVGSLKERITNQIQMIKNSSGFSKIEIVPKVKDYVKK